MQVEKQCCNLQQAKRLNDLGVCQGYSIFFYNASDDKSVAKLIMNSHPKDGYDADMSNTCYSAFTDSELGVMLPLGYYTSTRDFNHNDWMGYDHDGDYIIGPFKTEVECRAEMLIQLIENKLITVQEINTRLMAG